MVEPALLLSEPIVVVDTLAPVRLADCDVVDIALDTGIKVELVVERTLEMNKLVELRAIPDSVGELVVVELRSTDVMLL